MLAALLDLETYEWILAAFAVGIAVSLGVAYGIWRGGNR